MTWDGVVTSYYKNYIQELNFQPTLKRKQNGRAEENLGDYLFGSKAWARPGRSWRVRDGESTE
jgi:hypothetical protein